MNETVRLFERWKREHGLKTDAEAARKLGIKRQTVDNWRHRGSHAEADLIVRMCEDLSEDLSRCLKRIAAERKATRRGFQEGARYELRNAP
jgi:hypothetical protein